MTVKQIARISSKNRDVDVALDPIREALNSLIRENPHLGAVSVSTVALADAVTVKIPHGLQRKWRGWVVTAGPTGASTAGWISNVLGVTDQDRYLSLQANDYGATVTVDLLIW